MWTIIPLLFAGLASVTAWTFYRSGGRYNVPGARRFSTMREDAPVLFFAQFGGYAIVAAVAAYWVLAGFGVVPALSHPSLPLGTQHLMARLHTLSVSAGGTERRLCADLFDYEPLTGWGDLGGSERTSDYAQEYVALTVRQRSATLPPGALSACLIPINARLSALTAPVIVVSAEYGWRQGQWRELSFRSEVRSPP